MPGPGATTNLQLPYLEAAQAQKHVTVNEALRLLDALVQGAAISRTVSAQPASPVDGDIYILPAGKTGAAWGGMTNFAIAYCRDGVWSQITPREGWTFYVKDEDQHAVYSGAAWGPILSAAQTAGFRNRLHNAAFAINQRGLTSVADDAYGFDRWYVLTSTGAVTLGALTDPEIGRPTGIRLTQPDATPKRIGLAQIVEAANIKDLRSVAAAMAARVRCSSSQPIRMAILEWTGAADVVTSDVVTNWTSTSFTAGGFFNATTLNVIATGASTPAANTWTDLAQITGSFGASLNNAIAMVWTEGALAQNATLDLDQAQLEPGAACGAFARRALGEELALCQRYCEVCNEDGGGLMCWSDTTVGEVYATLRPFAVAKRIPPAMTLTNRVNIGFPATPGGATASRYGFREGRVASATGSGRFFMTDFVADAEL
ncbi:MAG: DUF2793 domain-containing protein [Hyphomonadaceae bacterium]|nr:DUF2793 domain-containing protein [Hyphomonadaceae bacterium]